MPRPEPDGSAAAPTGRSTSRQRSRLRMGRFVVAVVSLALWYALLGTPPGAGQSGPEIVRDAVERFEARLSAVEDLMIRHEVMGITVSAYMVKDTANGRTFLRPADNALGQMGGEAIGRAIDLWATPHRFYGSLADRWTVEEERVVDGREAWALRLDDLDDVNWGGVPGHDASFAPSRIELELSVEELLPLSMRMAGELDAGGEVRPFAFRVRLSDYREVEGYLHPFLTEIETEGGGSELSEEEIEEARRSLRELQRALDDLPPEQRAQMERMMDGQLRMLEEIVAGEGIRLEIRVTELEVNAGPPHRE